MKSAHTSSWTDLPEVRRRLGAQSPARFAQVYLPHLLTKGLPSFQVEILNGIASAVRASPTTAPSGHRVVAAVPAGYGKSTLAGLILPLWCAAYALKRSIVLSANDAQACAALVHTLRVELTTNRRLLADFRHLQALTERGGSVRQRAYLLDIAGTIRISTLPRGTAWRMPAGVRAAAPDLVVFDDIESMEQQVLGRHLRVTSAWWAGHARPLLDPGSTAAIFVSTRYGRNSLLSALLEPAAKTLGWGTQRVFKAVTAYASDARPWMMFEQIFRGSHEFQGSTGPHAAGAFLASVGAEAYVAAQVLWPEHETYLDLMKLKTHLGWWRFDTARQQRVGVRGIPMFHVPGVKLKDVPTYWTDDAGIVRQSSYIDEPSRAPIRSGPKDPPPKKLNAHAFYAELRLPDEHVVDWRI